MRIFRVGQTQLQRLRCVLNGSRRYYIVLALAGAIIFSPLMPHSQAQKKADKSVEALISPKERATQGAKDAASGRRQTGGQKVGLDDWSGAVSKAPILAQKPSTSGKPLRARWIPEKPKVMTLDAKRALAGVFVIKFAEGSHVRLTQKGLAPDDKNLQSNPDEIARLARRGLKLEGLADELANIRGLLLSYQQSYGFEVDSMFRFAEAQNDAQFREKAELEQRAGEELGDLDLYYVVHAKDFKDLAAQLNLMNQLNGFRSVEQVYAAYASEPPQAATPDIASSQGYLDPAPSGLDGRFAWTQHGGRGDGVRVVDIEYDWVTEHEDFPSSGNLFWGGRSSVCPYVPEGSEHGTAVMGIIAAPDNGLGVTGFASNSRYGLSSVCRPADYAWAAIVAAFSGETFAGRVHSYVVGNAIEDAARQLAPGDVLLIEQHVPGPVTGQSCNDGNCTQWEYVPVEYYQEVFDVIRRATARGVIVVEAAGNGGQNLDNSAFLGRFAPANRHSGAILVGASGQGDRMAAAYTSSSKRLDVFAWGSGVVTLGYGGGTDAPFNNTTIPRFYTSGFSGTSSASAIIAGAVTSLQGVRRATGQLPLMPSEIRDLLVVTGSPQLGSPSQRAAQPIGVQPNLHAAIDRMSRPAEGFGGPGYYTIRSKSSGKVLDVDVSGFRGQFNGQRLVQWDLHGGRNQVFQVIDAGGRFFAMRALHSGKALDVIGGSAADDAVLQQWEPHGGANQQFQIVSARDGYLKIIARHSGRALDSRGAYANGAEVHQWTLTSDSDTQLFSFTRLPDAP